MVIDGSCTHSVVQGIEQLNFSSQNRRDSDCGVIQGFCGGQKKHVFTEVCWIEKRALIDQPSKHGVVAITHLVVHVVFIQQFTRPTSDRMQGRKTIQNIMLY